MDGAVFLCDDDVGNSSEHACLSGDSQQQSTECRGGHQRVQEFPECLCFQRSLVCVDECFPASCRGE